MYRLLSVGNDAKTVKGQKQGYLTGILYLAPAAVAGGPTVCPFSTEGCRRVCLYTAGRGGFNIVQQARIKKTKMWLDDPITFLDWLRCDLDALRKDALQKGWTAAVRLNGTSDIRWEDTGIMEANPDLQFYDYTKFPPSVRNKLPPNYHLTYSLSEKDTAEKTALAWWAHGVNTTIVFDTKKGQPLPATYILQETGRAKALPVIDGDLTDLRFTDPKGVIVGLRAKGKGRSDDGDGFIRKAA